MTELELYYNKFNEEKRLNSRHGQVEFRVSMKYIHEMLEKIAEERGLTEDGKADVKILDIGAGTGRYSLALAEKGYDVTAVELVPHNIEIMKKKVKSHHNIKIYEGNACDLSAFESKTYDIVLLLGPMYHLFTDEDKHLALDEAIRVAKTNGVIYASYCNNDTSIYTFFYKKRILEYLDKGLIKEDYHTFSSPEEVFELYRKSDIDNLMKSHNVTR